MNSKAILIVVLSILALLFTYFALFPASPSGYAVAGFSASLHVSSSELLINDFAQQSVAVANGDKVVITIPIRYSGTGSGTVAVPIPSGYELAQNWTVRERSHEFAASSNSTHISWVANFSINNAILQCKVNPPVVITTNVSTTQSSYSKKVKVVSDAHFTNAQASVEINNSYPFYRLYLSDDGLVDVTSAYGLSLNTTHATWSGFSLSEKDFVLVGSMTDQQATDEFRGRKKLYVPKNDSKMNATNINASNIDNLPNNDSSEDSSGPVIEMPLPLKERFSVSPKQFVVAGSDGDKRTVELAIVNNLDRPARFNVTSDSKSAIFADEEIAVDHVVIVPIQLAVEDLPVVMTVSDGNSVVHVKIIRNEGNIVNAPAVEKPEKTRSNPNLLRITNACLAIILFFIVLVLCYERYKISSLK